MIVTVEPSVYVPSFAVLPLDSTSPPSLQLRFTSYVLAGFVVVVVVVLLVVDVVEVVVVVVEVVVVVDVDDEV